VRSASRRPAAVLAGAVGVALATTACVPQAATRQGRDVAQLYWLFMAASAVVFVVVVGLLTWSMVRYRGRPGRDAPLPTQTRGNMTLEVIWWALPSALVVVLAVLTIGILGQVDAREDEPQLVVQVRGFQWGWEFTYADVDVVVSGSAANPPTIELPVGETIAFEVVSDDVIHSFWIPRFLIKRDAVPNHPNRFDVVIEEEGTYGGQCGEFCGLLHSRQLFEIDAVPRAQFDEWLAAQPASS
jgi:cytochrome c oxidase subunit 2